MDALAFVAHVGARHPDIADEVGALDAAPNATLAAGALARLTRRAIDAGERPTVSACFDTVLVAWDEGDNSVQNSIGLSYLRNLNFKDGRVRREWAWQLLHPRLQDAAQSAGVQPPS
jgi:hypothetical protein